MRSRIINIILFLTLSSIALNATVDLNKSLKVAENIFIKFNQFNENKFLVKNYDIIKDNNIDLIYVYHLSPVGFI